MICTYILMAKMWKAKIMCFVLSTTYCNWLCAGATMDVCINFVRLFESNHGWCGWCICCCGIVSQKSIQKPSVLWMWWVPQDYQQPQLAYQLTDALLNARRAMRMSCATWYSTIYNVMEIPFWFNLFPFVQRRRRRYRRHHHHHRIRCDRFSLEIEYAQTIRNRRWSHDDNAH